MKTHLVLDGNFEYTPIFAGTQQECEEECSSQGHGFVVVPMTCEELKRHNPDKHIVTENHICPMTGEHCDDETCTPGSECNLSDNDIEP